MEETMIDYIRQTSIKMEKNISETSKQVTKLSRIFIEGGFESVIIVASGSSYNAAIMAQQSMIRFLEMSVAVVTSEQIMFKRNNYYPNPYYIAISQSGASTNTIESVEYLRRSGKAVGILTGNLNSKIAEVNSELVFDYGVGDERVLFVTLGLSTLFEFLYLFAVQTAAEINHEDCTIYVDYLRDSINQLPTIIDLSIDFINQNEINFGTMDKTFVCGNDVHYGVAREGALKLQETIHIPVMHYEVEEFLHGPDIQLTPDYSVFLIDDFEGNKRIHDIHNSLRCAINNRFLITFDNVQNEKTIVLPRAAISELNPLHVVIFFQVLSAMMRDKLKLEEAHPFTKRFRNEIPIKIKK